MKLSKFTTIVNLRYVDFYIKNTQFLGNIRKSQIGYHMAK